MPRTIALALALAFPLAACQGQDRNALPDASKAENVDGNPPASRDKDNAGHGNTKAAGDPHAMGSAPGGDPHDAANQPKGKMAPSAPVNPREVTPSGKLREETVAGLKFKAPEEWEKKTGSSPMRLAEYTIPGPGGDAELALFRFAGGGGDVPSNINRWRLQFTKADGAELTDADVKQQTFVRGPLKVTVVDMSGTYVAQVIPGAPERHNAAESRMLGVIIEGQGDPYFFKAVGPARTLAVWEPAFNEFAGSVAVDAP